MLGSGPDDGDVLEMGPDKPRRGWAIGRRGRVALAVAGVCALLAAGGTVAGLRLGSRGPADPALNRLITEVTTVPVSAAGSGSGAPGSYAGSLPAASSSASSSGNTASSSIALFAGLSAPTAVNGRPLTSGGKPEVLFVGTEYCPYCVAESWPLIVALSRFGQFSGLRTSRSPDFDDVAPTDGWTFYGSSYTSRYLAFDPVETYSNVLVKPADDPGKAKSYRQLQRLTAAEQAVLSQYDNPRQTPFIDFGGTATQLGSGVVPTVLAGLTWSQIAADLRHPATTAGGAILFAVTMLTSELCQLTGDRPAAACRATAG
jgi:Domain of unknown function (DUF929)